MWKKLPLNILVIQVMLIRLDATNFSYFYMLKCQSMSTLDGGMDLVLKFVGDLLDDTSPVAIQFQMDDSLIVERVCPREGHNSYNCSSPDLNGYINVSFGDPAVILPCDAPNGTQQVCIAVYSLNSNGRVRIPYHRGSLTKSTIQYYKVPVIDDFTVSNSSRKPFLTFTGKGFFNCSQNGYLPRYQIEWGDYSCIVKQEGSTDTQLSCEVNENVVLSKRDKMMVRLGDAVLFNSAKPNWRTGKLLLLIIVLPIVVVIVAIVIGVTCYFRRRQRALRRRLIGDIDMVQCANIAARIEELPDDLKSQVDPLLMDAKNISLGSPIGAGYFGEVRRAIMQKNGLGSLVAVKFYKDTGLVKDLGDFLREAVLMCHFKHPNVLECYGIFMHSEENKVAIVVPLMQESDLRRYVCNNKERVGYADIVNFSMQVAEGMRYLSDLGYVHRDLAARNCLVDSDHAVKVSDFGMSRTVIDEEDYYKVDTLENKPLPVRWMAPESLQTGRFTIKTDWSFGILVWELCTKGRFPFVEMESYDVVQRVTTGYHLERTSEIHQSLYDVMVRCWAFDPSLRPSFAELVDAFSQLKETVPNENEPNYIAVSEESPPASDVDDYSGVEGYLVPNRISAIDAAPGEYFDPAEGSTPSSPEAQNDGYMVPNKAPTLEEGPGEYFDPALDPSPSTPNDSRLAIQAMPPTANPAVSESPLPDNSDFTKTNYYHQLLPEALRNGDIPNGTVEHAL